MTSTGVRQALLNRWYPSEYLSINEAPQSSDRQGRKIDVLVVSLWRSRGYELDAVEIKVSVSDWRRELKDADKADWWWGHVHRFWVAVPAEIAATVRAGLPSGWGLLSCTPERTVELVKPEGHEPEPIPWGTCIGLMRASANAGYTALQHAEQMGERRGKELAQKQFERTTGDESLRRRLTELSEKVEKFEQASGIDITKTWDVKGLGESAALVQKFLGNPTQFKERLERLGSDAEDAAKVLRVIGRSFDDQ